MSQFVLLWSKRLNELHVEPLERMLSVNRECYRDNEANDFLPLVIGTEADIDAAAEACRPTLAARGPNRAAA